MFSFAQRPPSLYTKSIMIQKYSKLFTLLVLTLTVSAPLFAAGEKSFFNELVDTILTPLIGLISAGTLVYFLFGVMRYFIDKDQNEEARTKLRTHLTWGLLGLFIIFSIGGIISFVSSFGGGFK